MSRITIGFFGFQGVFFEFVIFRVRTSSTIHDAICCIFCIDFCTIGTCGGLFVITVTLLVAYGIPPKMSRFQLSIARIRPVAITLFVLRSFDECSVEHGLPLVTTGTGSTQEYQ